MSMTMMKLYIKEHHFDERKYFSIMSMMSKMLRIIYEMVLIFKGWKLSKKMNVSNDAAL